MSRDSWCTPKWLAEAIGPVYLDPCSNERSHIQAVVHVIGELGDDGLYGNHGRYRVGGRADWANIDLEVFINPPYSRGQVIQWVHHWKMHNSIFLLRWDPSTEWFRALMSQTNWVWFADRRIEFEPPPGIAVSSNPYPHALFFTRTPPADRYERLNNLGQFFQPHG